MRLNSFELKWIAIITMLIDHIGAILLPQALVLRVIGRIAFPLFCFQLTEGFIHTGNIRRYVTRLGIFALISEVPFDLAFHDAFWDPYHQNVFFTLLIGVAMMAVLEQYKSPYIRISCIVFAMMLAYILHTDYSYKGILLILAYYTFRSQRDVRNMMGVLWNFVMYVDLSYPMELQAQYFGMLAAVPISMYNGERGPKMKYFFYLFYPVHLLLLYICKLQFT